MNSPQTVRRTVVIMVLFVAAYAELDAGRPAQALPSPCCDCIVDNGCTTSTREQCDEWIHGTGSAIAASTQCLDMHGCWPHCAKEGVRRGG